MVKVGIISIGDELLNGFTVDSNSSYIAEQIYPYNKLDIISKVTVKDDLEHIKFSLNSHIQKDFNILFLTGGLGPTHDDVTRQALCDFFDSSLVLYEPYYLKLKEYFKDKKIENLSYLENQSMVLDFSKPLINKNGTALGMFIQFKNTSIFVMPGVPREMKDMLSKTIMPKYIEPYYVKNLNHITLLTTGIYENKLYNILEDIIKDNNQFKVAFLPSYTGIKIRLFNLKNDVKSFLAFKTNIVKKIDKYIYGYDNEKIEIIVAELIRKKKYTLSIAESCTGGLISKTITDVEGSSDFYKGSIVAYDNCIKINELGISESIINSKGAVSDEVARAMSSSIKEKFKTDIGIATTGISGPGGGSDKKPVGLIYIAISFGNKIFSKQFNLIPNRSLHRKIATHTALNMLRILLK